MSQRLVWDKTLRIGHERIDADHKRLIDISERGHRLQRFPEPTGCVEKEDHEDL